MAHNISGFWSPFLWFQLEISSGVKVYRKCLYAKSLSADTGHLSLIIKHTSWFKTHDDFDLFLMTYLSLETEAPLARCPDIFKDHMWLS